MSDPHPELVRLRAAHRRVHRPAPELQERVARAVAADRRREDAWRWIGGSLVGAAMGVAALLVMHWVAVGVATRDADERTHDAAQHQRSGDVWPEAARTRGGANERGPAPASEPAAPADPTVLPPPADADRGTADPPPASGKRASTPAGSPGADRAATSDLTAEVSLLREAEVALSTDPARALALLRTHAEQFPRTSLPLERRALQALARCATNPDDAAIRERDAFLREHPGSPYAARVRAACR